MGFVSHNSFGKFNAEVSTPLPLFSAESLLSLPIQQFGAATLDGNSITNYDPSNYHKFHVGDGGTGAGSHTTNKNGSIRTRYDKGFNFVMKSTSAGKQKVTLSHDSTNASNKNFTFILKPGDNLLRNGVNKDIVYIPADGSARVTTTVPWIRGGSYNITLDALTPITPAAGSGGSGGTDGTDGTDGTGGSGAASTCSTENRAANTDGTCGDCLSGFTEDDTGLCVADAADEDEDGPNYLLYGGGIALLVVGGVMAMKMMKKKK